MFIKVGFFSLFLSFSPFLSEATAGAGGPLVEFEIRNSDLGKHVGWSMKYEEGPIDLSVSPSIPTKPIISPKDKSAFSTVPIWVQHKKGGELSSKVMGTSFLVKNEDQLFLITNPHVLKNPPATAKDGTPLDDCKFELHMHAIQTDEMVKKNRLKILIIREPIAGFQSRFFYKAGSPQLELAVLDFNALLLTSPGLIEPFYEAVDVSSFAKKSAAGYLEEISMFGYPKGLINAELNMPLARTGKTATYARATHSPQYLPGDKTQITPYYVDFMIDAACFPGSSGSPVWLFKEERLEVVTDVEVKLPKYEGSEDCVVDKTTEDIIAKVSGDQKFLGVLFGGPMAGALTDVYEEEEDTALFAAAAASYPINLGWCIHAQTLKTFLDDYSKGDLTKGLVGFTPAKGK
jgi:hypothetical protein